MAKATPNDSATRARLAMRNRAKREDAAGYRRVTLALSPIAVEVLEEVMARRGYTSRQSALNALLERIDGDMFMRQEFMAVSG